MDGYRPCKRCGQVFRAMHGNRRLCGTCRSGGTRFAYGRQSFGVRVCRHCGREFVAHAAHQRFCSGGHERAANAAKARVLYANPVHRRRRQILAPLVATGTVRCARRSGCRRSEWVDGELVGGLILPGEPWHLGHPDGESVGGPEHRACNVGAPSRLRARKGRDW
jgi:hypothetical protein